MPDGVRRFGVVVHQDAPFPTLAARCRPIEAMGLDQVFLPDHAGDYRDLGGTWFDAWTVLAAMASETQRVRIGTLVSNPILRGPARPASRPLRCGWRPSGPTPGTPFERLATDVLPGLRR